MTAIGGFCPVCFSLDSFVFNDKVNVRLLSVREVLKYSCNVHSLLTLIVW